MAKRVVHRFKSAEDEIIIKAFKESGNSYSAVESLITKLGANHSRRAIIERYKFFLSQNRDDWKEEEDKLLRKVYDTFGPKWSVISRYFQKRSAHQVKIRYAQLTREKTESKSKSPKLQKLAKIPKRKPKTLMRKTSGIQ